MEIVEKGAGVYRCQCRNCATEYEMYRFSDFSYGMWLLQTVDGRDYAYLECFDNPDFDDLSRHIKKLYPQLTDTDQAHWLHRILGEVCDPINGKPLDVLLGLKCPSCGSTDVKELDAHAQSSTKLSIPVVTFTNWRQKSETKKIALITKRINRKE
ncbi:MAG TPA: hypothetical protein VGM23_02920 [Armatimonadota bacterium]|jgi:hypothetical protein